MRFLDTNLFVYAFYKPKKGISDIETEMKTASKEIIQNIFDGESVITTVVHLSEMTNILKHAIKLPKLHELMLGIYSLENIEITGISSDDYLSAIEAMNDFKIDPNDCLALQIMETNNINEIYSFDKGFDNIENIKRIPNYKQTTLS
jgi:uncharacterized protein